LPSWTAGAENARMDDLSVLSHIESLIDEEHALRHREQDDAHTPDALAGDRDRLRAVEVELDRCWDLLRQRRARRAAGADPEEAAVRSADTVEHYRQ
jgi:hypothetical protein